MLTGLAISDDDLNLVCRDLNMYAQTFQYLSAHTAVGYSEYHISTHFINLEVLEFCRRLDVGWSDMSKVKTVCLY